MRFCEHAEVGVEAAALEHHTQLPQGRRRLPPHVVAENADLAGDVVVEPGDQGEQRRLAGAVRPEQHHEGAARHGERDVGRAPALGPKRWLTPRTSSAFTGSVEQVGGTTGVDHFTMNLPAMPLPSRPLQPQAYSPGRIGTKNSSASPSRSISIS